jgi:hypothetical protein
MSNQKYTHFSHAKRTQEYQPSQQETINNLPDRLSHSSLDKNDKLNSNLINIQNKIRPYNIKKVQEYYLNSQQNRKITIIHIK